MSECCLDPAAVTELRRILAAAGGPSQRKRIRIAAESIGKALARNAEGCGESREGDERVAFERPLGLRFSFNRRLNEVVVIHVWELSTKGG